ncbi:hypothetical protein QBC43DRAFT_317245 [Cladorrhinum sp. PSN259]|nr:hypothetical protein QBC43DRAFT_317245 [Cladorrhinum sp. PSN259]
MTTQLALPARFDGSSDWHISRRKARYRDLEHSSSDSSDAGIFLISNVRRRVGAPPLKPLPIDSGYNKACAAVYSIFNSFPNGNLDDCIKEIAREAGVEALGIDVVARMPVGDGDTPNPDDFPPTILIVARWAGEQSHGIWEKVVTDTKKLVDQLVTRASGSLGRLQVGVEMVDLELTLRRYLSPILKAEYSDALDRDWCKIRDEVVDILHQNPNTKSMVNIVALFKLGTNEDIGKNPLTVFVGVDYGSEESKWPPILDEIQELLNRYPYKLRFHMEHNSTVGHYPSFEIKNKSWSADDEMEILNIRGFDPAEHNYNKIVDIGDDIGPARYLKAPDGDDLRFPGTGTLGCWVEIKTLKKPQWTKFALTNYHVVRSAFDGFQLGKDPKNNDKSIILAPAQGSDLWNIDINGVSPSFAGKKVDIESPTRRLHSFVVWNLETRIKRYPQQAAKLQRVLKEKKAFFDNNRQHLGTVYAASGYARRTKNNGRLDWALIQPTGTGVERVGQNKLRHNSDWVRRGYSTRAPTLPESALVPRLQQRTKTPSLGNLSIGSVVYKIGATTGPTVGRYAYPKPRVRISEDAHVEEHIKSPVEYLSTEFLYLALTEVRGSVVAGRGDSGSVVFDRVGTALGLLFRGFEAQGGSGTHALITPLEDVFEDIKAFSKNQITDIRIAKD